MIGLVSVGRTLNFFSVETLRSGTVDVDIKVTPCWDPRAIKRFLLYKLEIGQNIALHAAPAVRTPTHVATSCLLSRFIQLNFFHTLLPA